MARVTTSMMQRSARILLLLDSVLPPSHEQVAVGVLPITERTYLGNTRGSLYSSAACGMWCDVGNGNGQKWRQVALLDERAVKEGHARQPVFIGACIMVGEWVRLAGLCAVGGRL